MVALFARDRSMPEEEGARDLTMDPAYRAWLESNPAPGEVFVDTGEASAADSRKLRWDPTKEQREMIKTAIDREVAIVNERYQQDALESYAERVGVLVDETLREAGVDPVTLRRLPDANRLPGGEEG